MDDNQTSSVATNPETGAIEPEALQPRDNDGTPTPGTVPASSHVIMTDGVKRFRHRTFRPSHKATFIGLSVVAVILAVNVVILGLVLKGKVNSGNSSSGVATISKSVLNKVGVSTETIGNSGVVFEVRPDAEFSGKLTVAGSVNIAGALNLNNTFTATNAALTSISAGNTNLTQLGVTGTSTLSNLTVHNSLVVAGLSQLQGDVTVSNLTTSGNLTVGGTFSTNSFNADNITSNITLIIDGHLVTSGLIPAIQYLQYSGTNLGLGSNGTAAVNGNDTSGSVNIGVGVGATSGTLFDLKFHTAFQALPSVILSGINFTSLNPNENCTVGVFNLTTTGFSVDDNCYLFNTSNNTITHTGLSAGGYSIDYAAIQNDTH